MELNRCATRHEAPRTSFEQRDGLICEVRSLTILNHMLLDLFCIEDRKRIKPKKGAHPFLSLTHSTIVKPTRSVLTPHHPHLGCCCTSPASCESAALHLDQRGRTNRPESWYKRVYLKGSSFEMEGVWRKGVQQEWLLRS